MMVALLVNKLRAEADCDRAKAARAILDSDHETDGLRKSLQTMNEAYNELQTRHRAALEGQRQVNVKSHSSIDGD